MKILKRESTARNSEEELLISLSNEPLSKYVESLGELKVPQEIALKYETGDLDEVLN